MVHTSMNKRRNFKIIKKHNKTRYFYLNVHKCMYK